MTIGKAQQTDDFDHPLTFSVILNTCDRCDSLRAAIRSLESQTWPHFEVVVVVGPARDGTLAMLEEEFRDRIVVARCAEFNLSCSRNIGLENAVGDVVAFMDDDAVPCPTWLEQLAEAYVDPGVVGAGGQTFQARPDAGYRQHLHGRVSVLAEQEDVREGLGRSPAGIAPAHLWFPRCHGTNMSYRRAALTSAGGFDERFEYLFDDADSAVRLGLANHRVDTLTNATVYHLPGTGRNRGKHPYDLNWYCWLRSTIYFALKNGAPTIGLAAAVRRGVIIASEFHRQIDLLVHHGDITPELENRARRMLRRGTVDGFVQGLLGRRKLRFDLTPAQRPLRRFTKIDSQHGAGSLDRIHPSASRVETMDTRKLRVCLLGAGYPPRSTEGIARHNHMMALGLTELGHEVHVVTYGDVERHTIREGVYVHEIRPSERARYRAFSASGLPTVGSWINWSHAVYEQVRDLRIDHRIDLVDTSIWNLDGLVTAIAGEVPLVVWIATAMKQIASIHGQISRESEILGALETELLRRADGIVFNATTSVEALESVYGLGEIRVPTRVVPHGLVPLPDDAVEPLTGEQPEHPVVLYVGRLEKRKGTLELFDAIPRVAAACPNARFVIAGADNSREDGFQSENGFDYPTAFRRRFPQLAPAVEFLGFVSEDRLQELYRGCDVFVAPSRYESFGLIFLEAMNQARPVVGCASGGPKEIIIDGGTGRLVPAEDGEALANALVGLLEDPVSRREMGLAGRARFMERYTHVAMARGYVEMYQEVLLRRIRPVDSDIE